MIKPEKDRTEFDLARIAAAVAKRQRRGLRNTRNLAAGCQRQTATPRTKKDAP